MYLHDCLSLGDRIVQLGRHTKIGQLDTAVIRDQNVTGLDITKNVVLGVEKDETSQHRVAHGSEVSLCQYVWTQDGQDVHHGTTAAVL